MSTRHPLLPDTVSLPEKGGPVLAAAILHHCDILVTGDHIHFGQLYGKAIQGVSVLSPTMLAEVVLRWKNNANTPPLIFGRLTMRYVGGILSITG